eukprot:1285073-Pleurochrysis_carterae.AAC.1
MVLAACARADEAVELQPIRQVVVRQRGGHPLPVLCRCYRTPQLLRLLLRQPMRSRAVHRLLVL